MERLGTETAFSTLAKAKALAAQGREIIHLEIGEPDFDTPSHIVEAGCRALRKGHTRYTPTAGIPELRAAIATEVARSRRIEVDPAQVVVTPGGKPIMFFTILALVDDGEEVLIPNPAFPIYESMVNYRRWAARLRAAAPGERVPLRPRRVPRRPERAHPAGDPQLARQPYWRRADT